MEKLSRRGLFTKTILATAAAAELSAAFKPAPALAYDGLRETRVGTKTGTSSVEPPLTEPIIEAVAEEASEERPQTIIEPTGYRQIGPVSYYSRAGCVGCSSDRTMANGQPLNDWAFTLAKNELPLDSLVRVTNLDNSIDVLATVTDRGGYNRIKGRIADLTIGLYQHLQAMTDRSKILIETVRVIVS